MVVGVTVLLTSGAWVSQTPSLLATLAPLDPQGARDAYSQVAGSRWEGTASLLFLELPP